MSLPVCHFFPEVLGQMANFEIHTITVQAGQAFNNYNRKESLDSRLKLKHERVSLKAGGQNGQLNSIFGK